MALISDECVVRVLACDVLIVSIAVNLVFYVVWSVLMEVICVLIEFIYVSCYTFLVSKAVNLAFYDASCVDAKILSI